MATVVTQGNWRNADGVWVPAPATSHLKQFLVVFFKGGRHSIEVTFRGYTSKRTGITGPESTYRYWMPSMKDNDVGMQSVINVFNELAAAPRPGVILDAWLVKGGWDYARV